MKTVKVVFYWLSLVLPLIDAVRGVVDGTKRAARDVADDIAKAKIAAVDKEQQDAFQAANFVPEAYERISDVGAKKE